jgi:transcriptional regulator with GAF, ATPase, and Fis domain
MRACLTIEAGEGIPRTLELGPDRPVTLGRNRGNTIILHDEHASRSHAEIYLEDGHWFLRDCGTLNGTKLNGERIQQPTLLTDRDVIGIGDTRLRLRLGPASQADTREHETAQSEPAPAEHSTTLLLADELNVLCRFMSDCVGVTSYQKLIEQALETVHRQTGASVAGFLSLDADNPTPKLVWPKMAPVDVHLSRQLTQKVQSEGEPVWLGADTDDLVETDSLMSFKDALCLPLKGEGAPFGALHVYKSGGSFTERQLAFCRVLAGHLASSLQVLRARRQLEADYDRLKRTAPPADKLVGSSAALQQVRQQIERVAPRPCTVLIVGESGSGKELVALALHRRSPRHDAPLVIVNCAAITATLPEAELFGHCRGAFTGADADRPGFFQQADEGTLFLDEIGELSLECQAKVLRAIETKSFRPVGATGETSVDVRIIAATNRNLEQLVEEGKFRQDLLFRLGTCVKVPPLRDHVADIPALVAHFLPALALEYRRPVQLTEAALARLRDYDWPGNVRQLRSVLENAIAMSDGDLIDVGDLRLDMGVPAAVAMPVSLKLEDAEAWAIRRALRQTKGNVTQAAKLLDINRDTLSSRMRKYEIEKE